MNKIRVMHLIESLARGGAEQLLVTNLKKIDRAKFDNIVCFLYENDDLKSEIEKLDIPVIGLKLRSIFDWQKGIFGLVGVIKKFKIDAIHTHLFSANIYGRIAAKLAGTRVIITSLHNPDYSFEYKNFVSFTRRRLLDKITGNLCNTSFIAVSNFVKESAVRWLGFKNIKVIHNSINLEDFIANNHEQINCLRRELNIKDRETVIVTVGRLHPQKGMEYLFKAFSKVTADNPAVKLLVVGEGPLKLKLFKLRDDLNLANHITFLGNRDDVKTILYSSDIFVLPSVYEGFGISLLEAMATKRPVITTRIGGIPEIITDKETGILVDPGDSQQLKDAILDLMGHPQKAAQLAEKGFDLVRSKFNIDSNIRLLEELYERAYDSRKG